MDINNIPQLMSLSRAEMIHIVKVSAKMHELLAHDDKQKTTMLALLAATCSAGEISLTKVADANLPAVLFSTFELGMALAVKMIQDGTLNLIEIKKD